MVPSTANYGKVNIWEETNGVRFADFVIPSLLWPDKTLPPVKKRYYIWPLGRK